VRKTEPTLQCGRHAPLVKFGPLHPATRLMLQRFFAPWNDELRRLLRRHGVRTVPGYGLSPDDHPVAPPLGAAGKKAPRQQGRERARAAAAARAKTTVGFWWWPYAELEQAKAARQAPPGAAGAAATAVTIDSAAAATASASAAAASPVRSFGEAAEGAADGLNVVKAAAADTADATADADAAPSDGRLPPMSKKRKKAKSLLGGFSTGKVLKPVPRTVVRRETLIQFHKLPPGYEGSSVKEPPPTVKVFKQGQGHFSTG
jgi:hypothetical protein